MDIMNDINIDYKKIGEKIKIRRKKLNLSQSDLAEKIGSTSTTIGSIERGEKSNGGSVDLYIKIAIILGVSLDDLFDIDAQKTKLSNNNERLFSALKDLIYIAGDNIKFEFIRDKSYNGIYHALHYNTILKISDIGIGYYIQEYFRIIDNIKNIGDIEFKKISDNYFDKKYTEKMQIDNGEISYKPEFEKEIYVYEDESGPAISERKITKTDNTKQADCISEDGVPF